MGKLIKNHWARLIILTASACTLPMLYLAYPITDNFIDQFVAGFHGIFWPKIFWDILTKNLDGAVKPYPILQVINIVFGFSLFCLEWPLGFIAGSSLHRSIEARLVILPMSILAAALLYQGTNAALYEIIGTIVYFWAYSEGEVCIHLTTNQQTNL